MVLISLTLLVPLRQHYYDASAGRFLTRDPMKDGRNWYAYCENGPLDGVDADGLAPGKLFSFVIERGRTVLYEIWPKLDDLVEEAGKRSDRVTSLEDLIDHSRGHSGGPGHYHIPGDHKLHLTTDDMVAKATSPVWEVFKGGLQAVIETVDPTPMMLLMFAGKAIARAVQPWADQNNSGNWNHGGTLSYNDAVREALDE